MNPMDELHRRSRAVTVVELVGRRADIHAYVTRVREAAATRDFVDVRTAVRLADELEAVLDRVDELDAEGRSLVWAAIDYFLDESDAEADLTSPLGFDDDAEVVAALYRHCAAAGRAGVHLRPTSPADP